MLYFIILFTKFKQINHFTFFLSNNFSLFQFIILSSRTRKHENIINYMIQNKQATLKNKREITVIAHRGLSSLLPQNTLQSIIAGLYCAHFVEFDVLLTKDNEVVVFHDRGLQRLTNVEAIPKFALNRKQQALDNLKKKQKNWWVRDFTYEQLKQLIVKQPIKYRPQLQQNFKISKLQQIIEQCLKVKNKKQHKNVLSSGLLIQIKQEIVSKFSERDKVLADKVAAILSKYRLDTLQGCKQNNLPIIIQSFNLQILLEIQKLCQNQIVQLYHKESLLSFDYLLKNKTSKTIGVGVTQQSLLDANKNPSRHLKQICEKLNYKLFFWTVIDDNKDKIANRYKSYDQVYRILYQLGVDGFITEFPDKCKSIFKLQSTRYQMDKQQIAQKCIRRLSSKKQAIL